MNWIQIIDKVSSFFDPCVKHVIFKPLTMLNMVILGFLNIVDSYKLTLDNQDDQDQQFFCIMIVNK